MVDFTSDSLSLKWDASIDAYYLVHIAGRLDLSEAQILETEICKQINAEPRNLGLDMKDVHFMSSSGIRALICIMRASKDVAKTLAIYNIPINVAKIFNVVEITHLFEIYACEADAIARLA